MEHVELRGGKVDPKAQPSRHVGMTDQSLTTLELDLLRWLGTAVFPSAPSYLAELVAIERRNRLDDRGD